MSDDESTHPELVCWFCTKGRHEDCMKKIPYSSGEIDCSFSTVHYDCECFKNGHNKKEGLD